ncbi:PRC and DUF2382 domain-containing protein [Streptomyces sp. NPDC020707]|uniref:PRC and DUF2382 domain-containing protein n=1 Tax=Streptomyces ortus TaxID=2867268 RepID=A0ABT3UZM2_9ACTN|nr:MULTISPECIES: PRC and DUF2382 domain-containing protein [Streptomyces]MCX4231493.1 PRC and DUF2382 domain-containing protein [Streptomyces ortus]
MITQEQIPAVLEHPVYDAEGSKIGDANHVFFDDATGRPEWVSIKTGFFGTNESFVPIREAVIVEEHLEVPYAKGMVKDAPNVDVDSGGHLSESEEVRLYEYYGIAWDDAWQQANQPGGEGWAHSGTAGTAGAAGAMGTDTGMGTGTGMTTPEDEAMTRSEEHMHVGAERYETGRARLRKYVVTEEVQQTVPLRHEEVRVVREPITDANVGDALSGAEISEAEHEVTLHAERPVVETETVPVERVRLSTEEVTEEETVTGQVRKERIAADVEDDEEGRPRR